MKVALIGLGGMGGCHYGIYNETEGVEIVALVDAEYDRVANKSAECGARAYTEINEMLERESPDIVDICTPSYLHRAHAVAAMGKGINVITEKPAALRLADVEAMFESAKTNGVMFMTAQVIRFWPEYVWLKNAVESGEYGSLINLDMWRFGERPLWSWRDWMNDYEKSGLVAFDLHIHDVDFLIYLLGEPNEPVLLEYNGKNAHVVETACQFGKTAARARAAWHNARVPFQMGYEALFEGGCAIFRNDKLTFYPNKAEPFEPPVISELTGSGINVANTSGYRNELLYFIECVKTGKPPEIIKKNELLAALKLLSGYTGRKKMD
ncbi:MAG: Gfo/Idh/MocA family oxidoreductase [Defluviitaleaceae bacterium]|nr:Gfo/Idh/MocA family oxidoreductase [Defluviitaleaceae bacterium]